MAGQPERIFNMMITLVMIFGICSGLWGLLLAAQLLNLEKTFIQYLHHREPDLIRLFDFLAALLTMTGAFRDTRSPPAASLIRVQRPARRAGPGSDSG